MAEPRINWRARSTKVTLALTSLACVFLTHCKDPELGPGQVLIRVQEVNRQDEKFRVLLEDPDRIDEAERLRRSGEARWVVGRARRGDGGFNGPWSWHLDASDPAGINFAEVTIEECQTFPTYLEEHLEEWLRRTGLTCIAVVVVSP